MSEEKKTMMPQAEFARLAGVSRKTVTDWKHKGFLVFGDDGLVDAEASQEILEARGFGKFDGGDQDDVTSDKSIEESNNSSNSEGNEPEEDLKEVADSEAAQQIMRYLEGQLQLDLLTHAEAERFKENYLARSARLRYEKDAGVLVEKAAVEKLNAERWSAERDAWEVWPSTVCGQMAATLGVDQIKLRVELEKAVEAHLRSRVQYAGEEGSRGEETS